MASYVHSRSNYAPKNGNSVAIGEEAAVFEEGAIALWRRVDEETVRRFLFLPSGVVWVGYDPRKQNLNYIRFANDSMVNWVNFELRTQLNKTYPTGSYMPPEKWALAFGREVKEMHPCTQEVCDLVTYAKDLICARKKEIDENLAKLDARFTNIKNKKEGNEEEVKKICDTEPA